MACRESSHLAVIFPPARAAESLKAIAGYGEQKNVVINLENDDPESEDAFFPIDVIQRVASPYLRALPDFCNSMVEKQGDATFNYAAVKAMFAHAYNISHVKGGGIGRPQALPDRLGQNI